MVSAEVPLVVILGAGASRAAGNFEANTKRPPLTVDLFDEDRYQDILRYYDLAHQAGRFITTERADNDALALEQVLHGLRESPHQHHRHMAIAVPPYLQELLYDVSESLYTFAVRYDRLIERLLQLPYVFFVTLNYDVLLDRRLNGHHLLSTFDDYLSHDKNWSLLKLHGSVNWFHPTSQPYAPGLPPRDLGVDTSRFECVAPNADIPTIRGARRGGHTSRYPALALPEGPEDRLVLPREHVAFLNTYIRRAAEIDLLVIGYSGLDRQVLELASTAAKVRRMTVVNRDQPEAQMVLQRFRDAGVEPVWPKVVDGDFTTWADGGGLNQLVNEYGGPYSD